LTLIHIVNKPEHLKWCIE